MGNNTQNYTVKIMPYEARGKCVYKKGAPKGSKPEGCTTGDVDKYLTALAINVKTEQEQLKESFVALGRDKMFAAMVSVKDAIKNNAVNTSDAVKTIVKSIKTGEDLTSEQKTKIGNDLRTLLKNLGYGAVFMLPGGSVFIITFNLIKKIMDKKKLKSLNESNKLKGGEGDKMTPKKIADKFDVDAKDVKKQIEYGTCVECEHTDDEKKAKEIATDHVSEFPDYYNRLDKMEKQAKKHWGTDKKKENKKETMNETKSLIKRLVRENIQRASVEEQIQAQLKQMGLPPDTTVVKSGEPIGCEVNQEGELNEGLAKVLSTVVVVYTLLAGVVSCKKPDETVMYKYVYDTEASLKYSAENPQNTRSTCLVPYDHELRSDEIKSEQNRLELKYEVENHIKVKNDTLIHVDDNSVKSPDIDYSH